MTERICALHGPYDASFGECPVCSGAANRPSPPTPLDEDDMPTDIKGGGYEGGWDDDYDPTELGEGASDTALHTELGHGYRADETEFDFVDDSMIAILWVKEGNRRGRIHQVKDGFVVGRENADVDIELNDPKVSKSHARFKLEEDGFELWDFGSKNGTYVNGERIKAATPLQENDLIKFGDTVFVLKILD